MGKTPKTEKKERPKQKTNDSNGIEPRRMPNAAAELFVRWDSHDITLYHE
jgi:hypothetical protein